MGVEPIAARAARPAADFEDREAHRDSYTPADTIAQQESRCHISGLTRPIRNAMRG